MKGLNKNMYARIQQEADHPAAVQGYAYYITNFNYGCHTISDRLLNAVNCDFDNRAFFYEMVKTYLLYLEENGGLPNNELSIKAFILALRQEVSKRMVKKTGEEG